MSRETIATDKDGVRWSIDNYGTQKWLDGHCSGLDGCVDWLNSVASTLFSQRKVDEAIALQNLADRMRDSLRPEMVKRAQEHEKEFPSKHAEDSQ